ncbi:MAG: DUF3311 domain-containing protein [Propionibacteriaceae bacterium]
MADEDLPESKARDPRWRLTPTKIVVAVLLAIGIIAPLLVPTYSREEPRLGGFPFFYWYQLLWVFIAAGICAICYALIRREEKAYQADQKAAGE